jgi:hypothetical protein
VTYDSPSQGPISFSWTGPFVVNGHEVPLADYPRMQNPWTDIAFEDQDLALVSSNGAALYHDFARGIRAMFQGH